MKNKITAKSYKLLDSENETYAVRILDKKYEDVTIQYGKISLKVNEDSETATLSYKFNITDCPDKFIKEDLEHDKNFNTYVGDLLTFIIQSAFDSGNYKFGDGKSSDVKSTTDNDLTEDSKR